MDVKNIGNVVIQYVYYSRDEVKGNPGVVYVFGDNTEDRTKTHYIPSSTQAVIRGLDNAFGVDTKKNRFTRESSYYRDEDFERFCRYIDKVVERLKQFQNEGKDIVFPSEGLGTGKAMMKIKAPTLFEYLSRRLYEEFGFINRGFDA